jgi:hypothetical protein
MSTMSQVATTVNHYPNSEIDRIRRKIAVDTHDKFLLKLTSWSSIVICSKPPNVRI